MAKKLNISYDSELIEAISSDFDLRAPNKEALRKLIFTLDGDYDPAVMQVMNLATGVGKTYLMAAFIEYLRKQHVGNVVIITPGKVVQSKTIKNFVPGESKYIPGAEVVPEIVTPQDYSAWINRQNCNLTLGLNRNLPVLAFIFNIQQMIAPQSIDGDTHGSTQDAERRKPRRFDENAGVLFDYLKELDDLVVIADESHLYSSSAVAFNAALKEMDPAAVIGLTASTLPEDHVIYKYPLYQAIKDEYVKAPVLAFRKGGYGEDLASEEQQLRDALQLREIKQQYYDAFSTSTGKPHMNAVVFVVCSDVDHATQIAELLRSPEYLGNRMAVLQVDSKHDDETTQKLLERIDESDSPVLAVVSVNKLKEGWDVKNISVVVTLRAMASEVLTQQTMGRGLRLPFGAYTHVAQIDQLDIIAHQSFQELLTAENVLAQFGLEDAVSEKDSGKVAQSIKDLINHHNNESQGVSPYSDSTKQQTTSVSEAEAISSYGEKENDKTGVEAFSANQTSTNNSSTVTIRSIPDSSPSESTQKEFTPLFRKRNPKFADVAYKFPVTMVRLEQPIIDLSEISNAVIENVAKRVTSSGDILFRKEIVAALGDKLRVIDAESAEVDSIHVSDDDAKNALVKLVASMQMVPKTSNTINYISNYLVPVFIKNAPIDHWTVKSLDSARSLLQGIIKDYITDVQRSIKEVPDIHPSQMMLYEQKLISDDKFYPQIESKDEFVRGRYYSGWFKSLYTEESFDSYSGEYELARLLNTSPNIVWWHRLHPDDKASIYYNSKDRYFPDFVAYDNKGVYWIIEGKDQRGRDDTNVQAKRKAAESLVRKLLVIDDYKDQHWGYLIAYEDDIEKSDSWNDLKALSQPVSNLL